jgi:hypothetical protein
MGKRKGVGSPVRPHSLRNLGRGLRRNVERDALTEGSREDLAVDDATRAARSSRAKPSVPSPWPAVGRSALAAFAAVRLASHCATADRGRLGESLYRRVFEWLRAADLGRLIEACFGQAT